MIATVAVFAVAAAYFVLFLSYGFQLEDEGNILFLLDRTVRGQQPYIDFHTGYTPGFFAIGDAVYRVLGASTNAVRLAVAVNNAACAAGLYALARSAAGAWTRSSFGSPGRRWGMRYSCSASTTCSIWRTASAS